MLPAVARSNSNADESLCLNRMRAIMLSLLQYEDSTSSFPRASTQPFENRPGSTEGDSPAGYSWLVRATTYSEIDRTFWDSLVYHSKKFQVGPFADELKAIVDKTNVHPATHTFPEFVCPSFVGDRHVSDRDADYQQLNGKMPGIATYHAFAGSHFTNVNGTGELPAEAVDKKTTFVGNGAIPFARDEEDSTYQRGVKLKSIIDGVSQTLVFAESVEPAYAAWIDGQAMWVIAAWPGNVAIPAMRPDAQQPDQSTLGWDDADKGKVRATIGLRQPDGSTLTYLAANRWSGSKDRRWGPSSSHPGRVGHAFADGRAEMLATHIDPEVYLHLATRNGRESISQETLKHAIEVSVPRELESKTNTPAGRAVQVRPEQWSPIDWSPVNIGDLRLHFPQLLTFEDFRGNSTDPEKLEFVGKSHVFSSFTYQRSKAEFHLQVAKHPTSGAFKRLQKQLIDAFDNPGTPNGVTPARIVWTESARWPKNRARFEFVLTDAVDNTPPSVVIRILDWQRD